MGAIAFAHVLVSSHRRPWACGTMQDNTTIQIREDQRDALQDRKQHDRESYKAVLDRLLADTDSQGDSAETWTDEDVERVRSMLKTVDERTGRIERTLEDLRR